MLSVPLATEDPSLVLRLLSSQALVDTSKDELPVELRSPAGIPLHSVLHFVVAAEGELSEDEELEVAAGDDSSTAMLSFRAQDGSLIREDARTAAGTLDLDHAFGDSAFGALRLRAVKGGVKGEWVTLGTLIRRPHITLAQCGFGACQLHGRELYLIESVSLSEDFQNAATVPLTALSDVFTFRVDRRQVPRIFLLLLDSPSVIAAFYVPGNLNARER